MNSFIQVRHVIKSLIVADLQEIHYYQCHSKAVIPSHLCDNSYVGEAEKKKGEGSLFVWLSQDPGVLQCEAWSRLSVLLWLTPRNGQPPSDTGNKSRSQPWS